MLLVVYDLRIASTGGQLSKPISVVFERDSKKRLVRAITDFLSANFVMRSHPRYRDSDGDLVLLDSPESFQVGSVTF